VLADAGARLAPPAGGAHAILAADPQTQTTIAHDSRGAMRVGPADRPGDASQLDRIAARPRYAHYLCATREPP
jgi:hypothetical protein